MTLPTSGPISLGDIQAEFGGSNPIEIDEYYGVDAGVPTSGRIALSDFYGTSDITGEYWWLGQQSQSWQVPTGETSILVRAWGAGGGGGNGDYVSSGHRGGHGGAGGFIEATIPVTPLETLTIVTGTAGQAPGETATRKPGGGGGYVAIKRGSTILLVAGSGGGGGGNEIQSGVAAGNGGVGGPAGSNTAGGNGSSGVTGGGAASASAGGSAGGGPVPGNAGSAETGANGNSGTTLGGNPNGGDAGADNGWGGGGGAGRYGGGSGGGEGGAAGGGGGGGINYADASATVIRNLAGNGKVPPATDDPEYQSGVGVGGNAGNYAAVGSNGGHGLIWIQW